jgi:hypothetical protein
MRKAIKATPEAQYTAWDCIMFYIDDRTKAKLATVSKELRVKVSDPYHLPSKPCYADTLDQISEEINTMVVGQNKEFVADNNMKIVVCRKKVSGVDKITVSFMSGYNRELVSTCKPGKFKFVMYRFILRSKFLKQIDCHLKDFISFFAIQDDMLVIS